MTRQEAQKLVDESPEKPVRINTIDDLITLLEASDGCTGNFFISLAGGLCNSWKDISYNDGIFYILNEIDDSEQELTTEQMFDKNYTNIGEAITNGCFYFAWF